MRSRGLQVLAAFCCAATAFAGIAACPPQWRGDLSGGDCSTPSGGGDLKDEEAIDEIDEIGDLLLLQTGLTLARTGVAKKHTVAGGLHAEHVAAAIPPQHLPGNESVASEMGVTLNGLGDYQAFMSSLLVYGMVTMGCLLAATQISCWFPMMYANNVQLGSAPAFDTRKYFGWVNASLNVTIEQAERSAGLDGAMQLEFHHLCMKILASVACPVLVILCPLHRSYGGGRGNTDVLSRIGMGNVRDYHPWLYWVTALVVWGVVLITVAGIDSAYSRFLVRRFAWLKALPTPRSVTVLVEGIPPEFRSDTKLKEYFGGFFGQNEIAAAYVAKHTEGLAVLVSQRKVAEEALHEAECQWRRKLADHPDIPEKELRPEVRASLFGPPLDSIQHYTELVRTLEMQVRSERSRLREEMDIASGVNAHSGFVTFRSQNVADMVRMGGMRFTANSREWQLSQPPPPSDVRWADLLLDPRLELMKRCLGCALVAGLYIGFMPICVFITQVAYIVRLGPLQPMWAGIAPTLGLLLFLSFLPSALLLIFRRCFTLKADVWAQQQLQVWYFWFQVIFVILVTAIGHSLPGFLTRVVEDPIAIFGLLARHLPRATHFYMGYLVLQWADHAKNRLRYVQLLKFMFYRGLYGEHEARVMAEPEDQDYYGIGSRSARQAVDLAIGLIFSTLCPLVAPLAFFNFALCRLFYGYLLVFAETRKPDLGGVFYATQLRHALFSLMIYCLLMVSVLACRAASWGPAILASPSLAYVIWSYHHFQCVYRWDKLPLKERKDSASCVPIYQADGEGKEQQSYMQMELLEGS